MYSDKKPNGIRMINDDKNIRFRDGSLMNRAAKIGRIIPMMNASSVSANKARNTTEKVNGNLKDVGADDDGEAASTFGDEGVDGAACALASTFAGGGGVAGIGATGCVVEGSTAATWVAELAATSLVFS
jgi:hypothetical protein